jgi:hypothetical protein
MRFRSDAWEKVAIAGGPMGAGDESEALISPNRPCVPKVAKKPPMAYENYKNGVGR